MKISSQIKRGFLLQINSTLIAGLLIFLAVDSLGTPTYYEIKQDVRGLEASTYI